MTGLSDKYGDRLFQHVSRCYGFEQTDLGPGLTSELIRDKDGRISRTLKKYLWDYGLDRELQEGIDDLEAFWTHEGIPSRDLLLHNIVVQMADEKVIRLVVIDGLGSAGVVPEQVLPSFWGNRKARRKIKNFHSRIESFLGQRGHGEFPGFHGLLLHDGREEQK